MPFNLLLLPLIGGYMLLHRAYYWRFYLVRFDGHRLIFFSAFAGVVLVAAATVLAELIHFTLPGIVDVWHAWVPFAHSGKSALALALGYAVPLLMNRVPKWNRYNRVREAIDYFSNDLEMLLLRSMDSKMPVLLTMGSGKVYVGYLLHLYNPDVDREHIRIMPLTSGYRTTSLRKVVFTTSYHLVMEEADDPESSFYGLLQKDFDIVLPLADLKSASLFDFEAYEAFNREPSEDPAMTQVPSS